MQKSIADRLSAQGIHCQKQVPMSTRTTLKVGGPAECLLDAESSAQIAQALRFANDEGVPVLVVGNGSNMLVSDEGVKGLTIALGAAFSAITREGNLLRAVAGASLSRVAQAAQEAGLSGMEALFGIPGTVGGTAFMNAGAYGVEMAAVVAEANALSKEGVARLFTRETLGYGYRKSALMEGGYLVTSVTFELVPGDPEAIADSMRTYTVKRREKQPLELPSAGSFFKRPQGHFAGALIEAAGLKGFRVGGAMVSDKHAGFLVNVGGATARDFIELAEQVKTRVFENSGVTLTPEVRYV